MPRIPLLALAVLLVGCTEERFARFMVESPNRGLAESALAARQADFWAGGPFGVDRPAELGWSQRRYLLPTGIGVGVFVLEPLERPYRVIRGKRLAGMPGAWAKRSRRAKERWWAQARARSERSAEALNAVQTRILPARATVLILPGLGMGKFDCLAIQALFANEGYRSIAVDLRGQGDAGGDWRSFGARETGDLTALLDALHRDALLQGPLVVYGMSYGGSLALQFAARDTRPQAVVAVEPYADLDQVLISFGRAIFGGWVDLYGSGFRRAVLARAASLADFDPTAVAPLATIPAIEVPVLLLHGREDRHVPAEQSERLFAAAPAGTVLHLIPERDHVSLPSDVSGLPPMVFPWLESVLALPSTP